MVMLNNQMVTTINQSIHLRFLSFPHKACGGGNVELHLGLLESRLNDGVRLVDVRIANEKHFFRLLTQFQFDPNVLDVTLVGEIREDAM